MDNEVVDKLVRAANAVIDSIPITKEHQVACALLTSEGKIYTGVNVHHFASGTCAELVALGSAATAGETEITHIVAVGNRKRGVVNPCGRCRQTLIDQYRCIQVIVRDSTGALYIEPIQKLLPYPYLLSEQKELEKMLDGNSS